MTKQLPSVYQSIIHSSRYSRYVPELNRRETWEETVKRAVHFLADRAPKQANIIQNDIRDAILNLEVMPSMRLLMSAGVAAERDNVAAYNCSYTEVDSVIAFDEIMYILLCGTGVGFSCERQAIASLPVVGGKLSRKLYVRSDRNFRGVSPNELSTLDGKQNKIHVADSKYGWASALRILIVELYNGNFNITWDLSAVRSAGAPLKTFGGRASGPEPLNSLFTYCVSVFSSNAGNKLNSIHVHGLVCKIAEVVVVGGVRRSALISLSNLSDDRMRHAKSGSWWENNPEFALANNSICYTEKPEVETFLREMQALIESKSGERGIYNQVAAQKQAARWGRRDPSLKYGTNPCSEIILRNKQFCNLTEVVVRSTDSFADLKKKVELATILGTIQATLTDFKYLSTAWTKNTEEERLLGVSLTGIMDHPMLNTNEGHEILGEGLEKLRNLARKSNEAWAKELGIPASAAITCVKPSGTVSQLVDSASGIHSRHSQYYIRRIRMDKKDPMYQFLKDKGLHVEDDVMKRDSTAVFSFPMKAPEGAVCRKDRSAIEQLNLWLVYQRAWCEHKPSVTISVKDEEWPDVIACVWKHFDEVSGISFLPFSDYTYQQAPYEDITEEKYNELMAKQVTEVDFSEMVEVRDNTEGSQTLACVAGHCEV